MSKERELLIESLEWMQELKYVWADERDSGDRLLLIADINKVEQLLAQPERDKVDFQTLNEMGLRRLKVSDTLVLQESCAKSPTLIFAEKGAVIEIIGYKKLLEIKSFIDEILNYADIPQIGVDDMDKPVAWFYERQIEGFTERTMSVGFEENFDGVTIPLYLAPPTRKPLSYEAVRKFADAEYMVCNNAFTQGVRWAEGQHGITGVDDE